MNSSTDEALTPLCDVDTGDTAWMLFATTFVMLQTPATGLAQAGLVRRKNALSLIAQAFIGVLVGSFLWFALGFSLTFGQSHNGIIGGLDHMFFQGVGLDCLPILAPKIPGALFASFQMMFSLMVPVLVTGAWAEKLPLEACLIFFVAFPVLVYYPIAHWIWNPHGWLAQAGVKDFAGGLTIHTTAGTAALVVSLCVEKRRTVSSSTHDAHNLPLTMIGTALVWAGWYSFNGGSALAADSHAASALLNTQVAACSSGFVWVLCEYYRNKKVPLTSMASGVLAGLAAVTPGSGFISAQMSFVVGLLGGFASFFVSVLFSDRLNLDDVLDVTALQAAPGLVGSIFVGLAAQSVYFPGGEGPVGLFFGGGFHLLWVQLLGAAICVCWTLLWTAVIMRVLIPTKFLNISPETEAEGLDKVELGEQSYDMMEEAATAELLRDPLALASQLCEACASGNLEVVQRLLRSGADPCTSDYDDRTPIHLAASEGYTAVVAFLLDHCSTHAETIQLGCAKDRWGQTPLLDAMNAGHKGVCALLTERGCGLGTIETEILTERMCTLAFASEGLSRLTLLLDAGAPATVSDYDRRTPLHIAAAEGNEEAVRLLLQHGADAEAPDRWGSTPKDEVSNNPVLATIRSLFNSPVQPSASVFGAFKTSVGSSFSSNKPSADGVGLSASLLQDVSTGMAGNLQQQGQLTEVVVATPASQLDRERVSAATTELCAAAAAGDLSELRRLLRKKADPSKADYDGRTPLHLAASEGCVAAIELLLEAYPGLDVNALDRHHHTPLADALEHGKKDAAAFLQARGASVFNRRSAAALCWAAFHGDITRMQSLIHQGRDPNVADYDGRTALMLAASEGWADAVRWLLAAGADPALKDRHGHTALDDAVRGGGAGEGAAVFEPIVAALRLAAGGAYKHDSGSL